MGGLWGLGAGGAMGVDASMNVGCSNPEIVFIRGKTVEALAKYLSPVELPLDQIFLDPNNPRFTGSDWVYVEDGEIANPDKQEQARKRLIADFDIDKLKASMEINGYLPVDRIVVRSFAEDKFVVLEGNRRICAAKSIKNYTAAGESIPPEITDTLKSIPCLVYTGEDDERDAAWIFQGLRHISGLRDWSAYHKAKLLVEQMEKEGLSLTAAGKRFGLTPFGAGQWVRGYFAFRQAQTETDVSSVIDEKVYPYLQEIFGRSSIPVREWLEWDDANYRFCNIANFNEFMGWFYPAKIDPETEESLPVDEGAWDRRVIGKRDDIRQIGYLISHASKQWMNFRQSLDLEAAYGSAQFEKFQNKDEDVDFSGQLFQSIDKCAKLIANTPLSVIKNEELHNNLLSKISELEASIGMLKG